MSVPEPSRPPRDAQPRLRPQAGRMPRGRNLLVVPDEFASELDQLERWAGENLRDYRRDTLALWLLKIPALVSSVSAGILARFNLDTAALVLGAVGSLCILIDGLNPRGALRNTHLRAAHDLRRIQNSMTTQWRVGTLKGGRDMDPNDELKLAAKIIQGHQREIDAVARYVRQAETAFGGGQPEEPPSAVEPD